MEMKRAFFFLLLILLLAATGSDLPSSAAPSATPPLLANSPRDRLWVTDDAIGHMEVVGDLLYISGFRYVGPYTGLAVPLDASGGTLLPAFPRVDGDLNAQVLAIAPDGNGGWYIGGQFSRVGGVERRNLAHVLPDYSLDLQWNKALAGHGRLVYNRIAAARCVGIRNGEGSSSRGSRFRSRWAGDGASGGR